MRAKNGPNPFPSSQSPSRHSGHRKGSSVLNSKSPLDSLNREKSKLLIFGFGYSAFFLAKKLAPLGFNIIGTTRDKERLGIYSSPTYELIAYSEQAVRQHLETASYILISTPPSAMMGDPVLADFSELLKNNAPHIKWLGYLSSTGVYGDHGGNWVDELSPSLSLSTQGRLRLAAEIAWQKFAAAHDLPLHIFRIAGIYGPHRNALTRIAQGKTQTIEKAGHFFSRIHVEDIAHTLLASINQPEPLSIYNIADDFPAPAHEVDDYAARLLHLMCLEKIPFEKATLSPMAQEFYTHHRRVRNTKIKAILKVTLSYPSYREGLDTLWLRKEYDESPIIR